MMEMTAEQAAEWGKSLSLEKVWAAFKETDRKFEEYIAEHAARSKETDRKFAESAKQLAQLEKNLDRMGINVGGLNRSLGELIETLIAARLWEKFLQYGLKRAYQRLPIYDEKAICKSDIDILLVDAVLCMVVEVKRELDMTRDVDEHLKRMRLIRQYPPEQVNNKELLGAMAGGVVAPDVKNYAYECGFFVLELAGESVHLITPPEGFVPKKW
jgi:hypothetical protein